MDDLDLTAAASLDELAELLRRVHLRADKPTYRALEQQTTHANGFLPGTRLRRVRLTRSILSDVLLGRKFPGKAFLLTFVEACGIDLENDRRWEQAWDRLAVQYQQLAPRSIAGATPTDTSVVSRRDRLPQSSVTEPAERYPEGFDPKTGRWFEGRKQERKQYAEPRGRGGVHGMWNELLQRMSDGLSSYGSGGSPAMLGRVLSRVALARAPVPRSAISKGTMLVRPASLAAGTVGKAVEALLGEGLLTEEDSTRSGLPGPPITPLRLGDKWAIVGIHIDQQRDGPDGLAGIICGLDRKPLTELRWGEVPRKGSQHDLRGLASGIRELTESLLAELDGPRKFLGVGVDISGHVYHGIVEDSVHAGWSQVVDLQQILTDGLGEIPELRGAPAIAENDANALAIHNYYEHRFEGLDVTLVTVFRQGIGGATLIDGRLYRGARGMAAEPGHLAVEYPEDNPMWIPPSSPSTAQGRTFGDECMCSTKDRKAYGHVDTLAVPARIEGQLAALKRGEKISLEQAAAAPLAVSREESLMFTDEAVALRRAGRALGRAITNIIDTLNPSQVVLRLPEALAEPSPQTAGTEYLVAVEREVDGAYSTGPDDARRHRFRLTVQHYADEQAFYDGAVAAATTVFNAFIEHALGDDGCIAPEPTRRSPPQRTSSISYVAAK